MIHHSGLKSGLGRVANRMESRFPCREAGKREIRLPDEVFMRVDPQEFVGRHLFWAGDYDPKIRAMLLRHLRPGDSFMDIGAHCGTYGLRVARAVGSTGRVVMVEPNPSLAADIAWSIERNGFRHVHLEQCAVGETDGRASLHFSGPESVTASLLPNTVRGREWDRSIDVSVHTVASIIASTGLDSVDVVKIDAEGLDDMIVGQMLDLRDPPRCIVFEQHSSLGVPVWETATVARLESAGYEVGAIAKSYFRLRMLARGSIVPQSCFDFVAVRRNAGSLLDSRVRGA